MKKLFTLLFALALAGSAQGQFYNDAAIINDGSLISDYATQWYNNATGSYVGQANAVFNHNGPSSLTFVNNGSYTSAGAGMADYFNGPNGASGNQEIAGTATPFFYDLVLATGTGNTNITNTNGAAVTHTFSLISGYVTTVRSTAATGAVKLGAAANVATTSIGNAMHVNGYVTKTGNTFFTFPVGDGTQYHPLGFNTTPPVNATDNLGIAYWTGDVGTALDPTGGAHSRTALNALGTAGSSKLTSVSPVAFWDWVPISGTSAVDIYVLIPDMSGAGGYTTAADMRLVGWNTTTNQWDNLSGSTGPSSNAVNTVMTGNISDMSLYSAIAIGSVALSNSVTTGTITGSPFCAGSDLTIPYTSSGTFTGTYSAQLSDASGSFTTPVSLTTVSSTGSSITATIPAGTATGTGYRVRIVNSAPATDGSDNGGNLTINALPTAAYTGSSSPIICNGNSFSLVFSGTPNASISVSDGSASQAVSLDASGAGALSVSPGTTTTYSIASATSASPANCTAAITGQSVTVTVRQYALATISGTISICNGSSTNIGFSGTPNATLTYNDGTTTFNPTLDGTGSATASVSPTANTTYTLTNASASGYCASTISAQSAVVSVNPLPQGSLSANGPFCGTGTGQLTWTATAGTGPYTVVYNDGTGNQTATGVVSGTPFSVASNPVTSTTTYTLVSVQDANCSRTTGLTGNSATITINPVPNAVATPSSQDVCSSSSIVTIVNSGNVSGTAFDWTRDNTGTATGFANSGTGNISGILYNATSAPITVTFTITPSTNSGACAGTPITATVSVKPLPTATISGTTAICSGNNATITFSGTPNGSVVYNVNSGNSQTILLDGTGTAAVTSTPSANATYTIANVTADGCTAIISGQSATVTVNPLPTVTITPNGPTTFCQGGSVNLTAGGASTYVWSNSATTNPITVSNAGTFTVTGTDANNCTATSAATTIMVNTLPAASISGNNSPVCSGSNATFTLTGTSGAMVTYNINSGSNTTATLTGGTATVTVSSATASQTLNLVSVTDGTCSQTLSGSSTVTVNPLPQGSLTANGPFCATGTGQLTFTASAGTGPFTVVYNDGTANRTATGVASGSPFNVFANPVTATKTYTLVSATDASCTRSTGFTGNSATITVNPVPNAVATPTSQTICNTSAITTIVLSGSVGGTTYNWTRDNTTNVTGITTPGSGNISGTLTNTVTGTNIAAETTTFTITPTAAGCTGTPVTAAVTVNPTPDVTQPGSQVVCNNGATVAVPLAGTTANTTYSWTNSAASIGLAASGTGSIPSFTGTNTTGAPVTATVTVTPSIGSGGSSNAYAYIPNYNSNNVSVINTASSNALVATIPVQSGPFGVSVSPDGTRVYVTNINSNSVSVINTSTNAVVTNVGVGSSPYGVVVSPDGSKAYVANFSSGTISIINTATNTATTLVTLFSSPYHLAISPDGSRLYASLFSSGQVAVINTATNAASYVTVGSNPRGICVSPDGSRVYVANASSNTVSVINTSSNTVIASPGVSSFPYGISCSPDGSKVFVSNYSGNSVSVITTATNAVSSTTITVGTNPVGISFTADGSKAYVANSGSSNLSVINTATNTVSATVAVGTSPLALGNFIQGSSSCSGPAKTFTITVNPTPTAVATPAAQTVCNSSTVAIALSGAIGSTTYSWSRDNTANVTGLASSGTGSISGTLTNTTSAPVTVTFTITPSPYTNGGTTCTGTPITATVVVNPTPDVTQPGSQTICGNTATAAVTFAGTTANTTYSWTNSATSIGLAASGTGSIPSFTGTNTTGAPVAATVTVTPYSGTGGGIAYAYIPNTSSSSVSVINTANNTVVSTISVGGVPRAVAINPGGTRVYIVNTGSNSVSVINTATNTVISTLTVGNQPWGVVLSPDGTKGYVTNSSNNNVTVFDATTNSVITTINVGSAPRGVDISPSGSILYVANSGSNTISVINTATNSVTTIIAVGAFPQGITVSPDGTRAYAVNIFGNTVSVINTSTNSVTNTIGVGSGPQTACVSPDGTRLYVTNFSTNNLSVINTGTNSVIATITVGSGPRGTSVTPDGTAVYVANDIGNSVSFINTATNSLSGTVNVGTAPFALGKFISGNTTCAGPAKTFTITVNPSPAIQTVTGGGAYCAGGTGMSIGLSASQSGVNYQLMSGSTLVGSPVAGTGSAMPNAFPNQMTAGTYTVVATQTATGNCTANMTGSATITVNPLPTVAAITGTTIVCTGNTTQLSDATSGGVWSSNSSNATVNSTGLVSGVTAGNATITYTVTNGNGCSGSSSATVTVDPRYAITSSVTGSNGTISPSGTANVCSGTSQIYTITASTAGNGYHIDDIIVDGSSLTGSAASSAGVGTGSGSYAFNSVTATHSISASFAPNCIPPVISCNNTPITQGTDAGLCTAVVNYIAATVTGTSPTISYSQNSGTAFSKGINTVTATAINACGTDQCSFNVTVTDNQSPVVACPSNVSLSTISNTCAADYTILDPISDNCTSATWSAAFSGNALGNPSDLSGIADGTNSSAISFNRGITTITLSGTDGSNAANTCSFTVTVTDNQNPTITAPSTVTVPGYCQNVPASAVTLGTPTGLSDNCASLATLSANVSNNAPASYPVGNTTVVWTVSDGNGNSATSNQTVTVVPGVITATAAVTNPLNSTAYPMSGQEIQTIYLNYPSSAQSETMNVTGSGGTGTSFSYAWTRSSCNGNSTTMAQLYSSGANPAPVTSNSYTWAPTSSDICLNNGNNDNVYIFACTVTDNHGCSTAIPATKKLNVVDPYVTGGNVQICHKVAVRGGSSTQILQVAPSTVATHLAHGDYLGNCAVFTGTKIIAPEVSEEQNVTVYPNPTTGVFILELSSIKEGASIMITDVAGKLIANKSIAKDAEPTATFDLSNLAKGMYLIQVRDGELNYRTKIVVQ